MNADEKNICAKYKLITNDKIDQAKTNCKISLLYILFLISILLIFIAENNIITIITINKTNPIMP